MMKIAQWVTIVLAFFVVGCQGSQGSFAQQGNESSSSESEAILPQTEALYKTSGQIPVPEGYTRVKTDAGSFGAYLRTLPLKTENNTVMLYNGEEKSNQSAQFAVVKMDIGKKDLQQCADAVMRLRAEYLFAEKRYSDIHFNFVSDGKPRYYKDHCSGNYSRTTFWKYMEYIFSYANTGSLKKELTPVPDIKDITPGDVFIVSGSPYGHAILVVDVAEDSQGNKIFMLAQSYMPAQETHILKNLNNEDLSPWYAIPEEGVLLTPEWTFNATDLRRW